MIGLRFCRELFIKYSLLLVLIKYIWLCLLMRYFLVFRRLVFLGYFMCFLMYCFFLFKFIKKSLGLIYILIIKILWREVYFFKLCFIFYNKYRLIELMIIFILFMCVGVSVCVLRRDSESVKVFFRESILGC